MSRINAQQVSKINAQLARLGAAAPVVVRLVVGGGMAYHGFKKFQGGLDGVEAMFKMVDAPAPAVTAPFVASLELIGGFALIAGVATRLVSLALAGVLTGAIILVKFDLGVIAPPGPMPGAELDLALLAGLVALAMLGPGLLAVDLLIGAETGSATGWQQAEAYRARLEVLEREMASRVGAEAPAPGRPRAEDCRALEALERKTAERIARIVRGVVH